MSKKLLEIRKERKAKKPKFIRQDAHKKARLKDHWRKPKGLQSKMKYKRPGYRRSVEVGWGSPKKVSGLTREGFLPVKISNLSELSKVKEEEIAVISSQVGEKKKIAIIKKAADLGIKIKNFKDSENYVKSSEEKRKKRKEEKAKEMKKKEEKKKQKEKKAEEKKKDELAEKLSDEEKKEKEKKEREKILTKKE